MDPPPRADRVCAGCGLSRDRHGHTTRHPWQPVAVADVLALPNVADAIATLRRYAGWLDYPAGGLLEATAFRTGVPRPLLEIAFAHDEIRRGHRDS